MTLEEIDEAIAKSLGWVHDGRDGWTDPSGCYHQALYGRTDKYGDCIPPNYSGSFDAIIPLVRNMPCVLTDEEWLHLAMTASPMEWCELYLQLHKPSA
jgi:hypothetical protein